MKFTWKTPVATLALTASTALAQTVKAPKVQVEMLWPKPLPTHYLLGSATGLAIDSRDHLFVLNLPNSFVTRTEIGAEANPPLGECCFPSSNVLEFDTDGNLVGKWGGPGQGYTWPSANNGIAIAPNGNVWIGGVGPRDTQILEFTTDGKFVRAIGALAPAVTAPSRGATPDTAYAGVSPGRGGRGGGRGRPPAVPPLPANSASMDLFGGATGFAFDTKANEAYVADGSRNHRIAVVDLTTGAIKRAWGANGKPADDNATGSAGFGVVSCVHLSKDGLLYVCDRSNDRIQVFKTSGEFVKEASVAPATRGAGSVWDIGFSRDGNQKYLYVADGQNMKVHILDRQSLDELSSFGEGGRQPGEFFAVHSVVTDSKGNIYTVESLEGKRLQKFDFKGVTDVPKNQGITWPNGGK
jgi:DNA-binding beta-propeller fold protein YncE